jgi:hypothetical protein
MIVGKTCNWITRIFSCWESCRRASIFPMELATTALLATDRSLSNLALGFMCQKQSILPPSAALCCHLVCKVSSTPKACGASVCGSTRAMSGSTSGE